MKNDLSARLITFGTAVIELTRYFGKELYLQNIKNQLIKSATSVGANYHEAQFASSKQDFINKLHLSLKELAESTFWIKTIEKSDNHDEMTEGQLSALLRECEELRKILTSCIITAKNNKNKK
jgi:four helix bundle protein